MISYPHAVFHSDRRYTRLNVKISSMVAAHNALWIATDTGVIVQFPFSTPAVVAEEQGNHSTHTSSLKGDLLELPLHCIL